MALVVEVVVLVVVDSSISNFTSFLLLVLLVVAVVVVVVLVVILVAAVAIVIAQLLWCFAFDLGGGDEIVLVLVAADANAAVIDTSTAHAYYKDFKYVMANSKSRPMQATTVVTMIMVRVG